MHEHSLKNLMINNARLGIFLVTIAGLLLSLVDGITKYLTEHYHIIQIIWARHIFVLIPVLLIVPPRRWPALIRTRQPYLQIGRALLMLATGGFLVMGLRYLPLADTVAIYFVEPVFVMLLAIPLLGERVGLKQWIAVFICFIGVTVLLRPGSSSIQLAAFFPVGAALFGALYLIITKLLSHSSDHFSTMFYTGFVGGIIATVPLPLIWKTPTAEHWILLLSVGSVYGLGQYLWVRAMAIAPASVLSPFVYVEIIIAAIIGIVIFNEVPDLHTLIGIGIIISTGLYLLCRPGLAMD